LVYQSIAEGLLRPSWKVHSASLVCEDQRMRMEWNTVPNVGVGPIRFGLPRDQVRLLLPGGYSEHPTKRFDWFTKLFLKVTYSEQSLCTAVSMYPRHHPTLSGISLLSMQYSDVRSLIQSLDAETWSNDDYVFSRNLGLVVASKLAVTDDPPDGLVVFEASTWQDWNPKLDSDL
jgi:hypothetical protein